MRQIIAGHGPVFNAYERVEATTSAAWTWLVTAFSWISGADPAGLAVWLGMLVSTAAIVIASCGSARLYQFEGQDRLIPAGALVVLALPPFWDFASSGLETGLTFVWIAASWCWLTALGPGVSSFQIYASTVLFGLGPLVRPELFIVTVCFAVAAWLLTRSTAKSAALSTLFGSAIPLAYELFRAGYYGVLAPQPAIAKGAFQLSMTRGVRYFLDYTTTYTLAVPAAAIAVAAMCTLSCATDPRRSRIIAGAALIPASLTVLYVIGIGGDFMHARMWLVPTFTALLPWMLVPLRRVVVPLISILASWSVISGLGARPQPFPADSTPGASRIQDERATYVYTTAQTHPVYPAAHIASVPDLGQAALHSRNNPGGVLVYDGGPFVQSRLKLPLHQRPSEFVFYRLGVAGAIADLDDSAKDIFSLADPVGAHLSKLSPDQKISAPYFTSLQLANMAGHEKILAPAWVIATSQLVDLSSLPDARLRDSATSARHALSCSQLKELLEASRTPLTIGRFVENVIGALPRTFLEIPPDPSKAERKFCR
ncbi:hypothetical protein [Mycobacterium haemophilum]|uniref:hypothetical protein n=1 Tax=Mycobacterium haemophilum TaxID=29311 RepID=UPI0012E064BF|nr:hypothetical protein [Mycobacterium haemophilum]